MADRALPDWPAAMGEDMAAAYIGISAGKLRELVANGRVRRLKLDGRFIYRRVTLDAFLDHLEDVTPPSSPEQRAEAWP